jgi:hypothetical protein
MAALVISGTLRPGPRIHIAEYTRIVRTNYASAEARGITDARILGWHTVA